MKLFKEELWGNIQTSIISEAEGKKKNFYIESEFGIQMNLKNRNQRIYPSNNTEKDLEERYIPEYVMKGRAWGELGHPDNARINEDRISHRFVEIKRNGPNYYYTKALVLDTVQGNILKGLIGEDGQGKIGQSTRAVGTLKRCDEGMVVQEDLYFVTAGDAVAEPSAQRAFVDGIKEGIEYEWMDGVLIESVIEKIDKEYKKTMSLEEKQMTLVKTFQFLMEEIKKKK